MNRLTAWIKTVVVGYRRDLTDEQLAGDACALCGDEFGHPDYRVSFGWIDLPFRRRAYAERIAAQAQRLGFTAMIDDEVKAAAATANPYASPESRAESARDAIGRFQAWSRLSRALGGNDKQVPTLAEVVDITNSIYPGIDLTAGEAQAAIDLAYARLERPLAVATAVITPDGPGIVIGVSAKVLKVTLEDGRTRDYPVAFVKPRNEDAR